MSSARFIVVLLSCLSVGLHWGALQMVGWVTVKKNPSAPHLTAGGKEYWFCSEDCKCDFAANPGKFGP